MWRSKVLSRKSKIIINKTIMQPIVLYRLRIIDHEKEKGKLLTFENICLWQILWPVKENGQWKIRKNMKEWYKNPSIIAVVKERSLRWCAHIIRREAHQSRMCPREKVLKKTVADMDGFDKKGCGGCRSKSRRSRFKVQEIGGYFCMRQRTISGQRLLATTGIWNFRF